MFSCDLMLNVWHVECLQFLQQNFGPSPCYKADLTLVEIEHFCSCMTSLVVQMFFSMRSSHAFTYSFYLSSKDLKSSMLLFILFFFVFFNNILDFTWKVEFTKGFRCLLTKALIANNKFFLLAEAEEDEEDESEKSEDGKSGKI